MVAGKWPTILHQLQLRQLQDGKLILLPISIQQKFLWYSELAQ